MQHAATHPAHFPLFEGGPFSPALRALRLEGEERRHVQRRIAAALLVTWVPLALLAAIDGRAIGATYRHSMLLDPAMFGRFVIGMPLLIAATYTLARKTQRIARHFLDAELIEPPDRDAFVDNIGALIRRRDSGLARAVLIALVVVAALTFGSVSVAELPASWRIDEAGGARRLSAAGWWLVAVSEPLYQIALLQLGYRLVLWWRFLWTTSRLALRLNAAHPDGAGGLGFMATIITGFELPAFAIGASAAGVLANVLLLSGASILSFRYAIALFVAGMVIAAAGPLLFFHRPLADAKQKSTLDWGVMAGRQLRAFEAKWLGDAAPDGQAMLRARDFSAVGDFHPTVAAVQTMRTLPFQPKQLLPVAIAAALPFLPVAAIEYPIEQIASQLWMLVK